MLQKAQTGMYHTDFAVNVKNVTKTFIQWQRDNTGKGLLRNLIKPEKLKITALDDITFTMAVFILITHLTTNSRSSSWLSASFVGSGATKYLHISGSSVICGTLRVGIFERFIISKCSSRYSSHSFFAILSS